MPDLIKSLVNIFYSILSHVHHRKHSVVVYIIARVLGFVLIGRDCIILPQSLNLVNNTDYEEKIMFSVFNRDKETKLIPS